MKIFLAITNMLVGFAKWSAIIAAVIMTVMVFLQVIFRYVLGEALSFSEELARYMFVWSVAMGSALALRSHSHIGVEVSSSGSRFGFAIRPRLSAPAQPYFFRPADLVRLRHGRHDHGPGIGGASVADGLRLSGDSDIGNRPVRLRNRQLPRKPPSHRRWRGTGDQRVEK